MTHPKPLPPVKLCGTMTVNQILHTYPHTKRLFERLSINIPYEGYDCLDEVAWRRGMDCRKLLALLEDAIGSAGPQGSAVVATAGGTLAD